MGDCKTDLISSPVMTGRNKIFSATDDITADNVVQVLNLALQQHIVNIYNINYLYWYRRGIQPILQRQKDIRPEICNKVVINNANQVVVFKNGYFLTKPANYKAKKDDAADKIRQFNEYLDASGKHQADNEVVDWFHTAGIGALLVEPNRDTDTEDIAPANVYSLDPRSAFVVYSLNPGNEPVMGVNMVVVDENTVYYDVFTKKEAFKLRGTTGGIKIYNDFSKPNAMNSPNAVEIEKQYINVVGEIPIIEYQYNSNRMGAFENALSIMDEINNVESNRADSIEQSVQNILVATNCSFEDGVTSNDIRESGMVCLKSTDGAPAKLEVINQTLDQEQTQFTLDDLYNQMLEKCGVPSSVRDGGSTSDNVGAVYLRSGWALADTDCRNTEDLFRVSNKRFDKAFAKIVKTKTQLDVRSNEYDLVFPRNDMNNLLTKVQVARGMKDLGYSPALAFEKSGLSTNPLEDVELSKEYIEKVWNNPVQDGKASQESFNLTEKIIASGNENSDKK